MISNPVIKLTVFLIFLHGIAVAQSDTTYFDANWEKTTRGNAVYFRPKPVKVDNDHYLINDHYMSSGNLQMKAISIDIEGDLLDGMTTWYYENGNVKEEVKYKKGRRKGRYKMYAYNGKLIFKGRYSQGLLSGDVVGYDSLSGIKIYEGEYLSGHRSYWHTWYYADGVTVKRLIRYHYGRIKKAYCYNEQRNIIPFDSMYKSPISNFGYADINDYLDHDHVFRAFKSTHKRPRTCVHVGVFFDESGYVKSWKLENNDTKEYQDLFTSIFSGFPGIGKDVYDLSKENGEYYELMHIRFRDIVYSSY